MAFPLGIGNNSTRIVLTRRVWDPMLGPRSEIIFEGTEEALNTQGYLFMRAGYKAEVLPYEGPVYRMSVFFGDGQDGSKEVPTDKWEIDTEWAEISIWQNPLIMKMAGSDLDGWRTEAEKAFAANLTEAEANFIEPLSSIYLEMLRGTRATEVKRTVLSRVRNCTLGYNGQMLIEALENVYTTPALITRFGIPGAIAARLPADPSIADPGLAFSHRTWAWKERKETSEFILSIGKLEEVKDWIFAPWSDLLYNVVTVGVPF